MEQEEIIAIAIREAFKCGKEEGEAYQRMLSNMNEKIEKAKKGEPDYPRGLYDGFFSQLQNFRASDAPAKPGTESEEVAELNHSSLPLDWYVISQKANHRRKFAERMYRKKYLKKKEECRYQTERADNAFEKISQLRSDLEDCKCELRKYKNDIERAVKEERERQEENDAMRIVSLQTLLKEKKALVEKLKEENEALRNTVSELTSKNQSNKE